jgi:hypothetical protein
VICWEGCWNVVVYGGPDSWTTAMLILPTSQFPAENSTISHSIKILESLFIFFRAGVPLATPGADTLSVPHA